MRFFVDFAHQDLLGSDQCKTRHLATQFIACAVAVLLDLGGCRLFDPVGFIASDGLGGFHDFIVTLLRLHDEFLGLVLTLTQKIGRTLLGKL